MAYRQVGDDEALALMQDAATPGRPRMSDFRIREVHRDADATKADLAMALGSAVRSERCRSLVGNLGHRLNMAVGSVTFKGLMRALRNGAHGATEESLRRAIHPSYVSGVPAARRKLGSGTSADPSRGNRCG